MGNADRQLESLAWPSPSTPRLRPSAKNVATRKRRPSTQPTSPGCRPVHIPRDEIEDYEGRLEYWEARSETAMVVCEPTTRFHKQPSHQLAGLTRLIAASRGSVIHAYGTTDLGRFDARGKFKALMQADRILYLHPPPPEELTPRVDVDRDDLPDVALEVDYSTDVRGASCRVSASPSPVPRRQVCGHR